MSQYRHSYSGYVNHILNKSPSKTAYSFSRSQRFPPTKKEQAPLQTVQLQPNRFSYSSGSPSKLRNYQYQDEDPYNNQHLFIAKNEANNFDASRQVQRILKKINNQNQIKSRSRPRNRSPNRQTNLYRNNQTSPFKRSSQIKQQKSSSPNSKSRSPNKNYNKIIYQSGNPSRNMTITGYYPVGTEISPQGRYASSRIQNVVGTKFSPLPSSNNRLHSQPSEQSLGPGYYPSFSEFGHQYNR